MSDTNIERVLEVFDEARQLHGEERARFLETACADDDALHAEVLSLLPHADAEASPVDGGVAALDHDALRAIASHLPTDSGSSPGSLDELSSELPETLGPYRIVRLIARGGMGTVYEATQSSPARRVALKTMRPELFTSKLLSRFQREAQILGRLQHPGIAQVFEAGTVEHHGDTLPYFAMEFVDGKPLDAFAADDDLGERERLKLFAQVCDAVHHAHTERVVHRDLKPDNILVTADGQPKILDFGIARITGADVADLTLVTEVGQIMGTLPYMSPEQVAGQPGDIDARSDVYALGVLLFELLSGRRPHELADKTLPDAARIIREQDATRLGSVATRWRGDVETIVGKALEKDRSRRYSGADELAADVRRHLSNQPIAARAPSQLYLVRKFAQRHQGLVIGLSIAFVALVAGLVISLTFAFDEAQQRREAESAGYRALITGAMAVLDDGERLTAQALLDEAPEALRGWEWRHAAARAEPLLWEIALAKRLTHTIPLAAFSPDESLLAVLVADDRVGVFDAETGTRLHSIELGSPLQRNCLVATAAGFLTITTDGHVTHWGGTTGELLAEGMLPGPVHSMTWSETGQRLAVASDSDPDGKTRLHVGPIGSIQPVDPGDTGQLAQVPVGWTEDGRTLVAKPVRGGGATLVDLVMDDTGPATLSRRASLDVRRTYGMHGDCLLVIPAGGMTDKLVVIDLDGDELSQLDPQLQPDLQYGAFSGNGQRIVTTSASGGQSIVTVYDAASGHAIARWPGPQGTRATLSPTGRLLAIGSPDRLAVMSLDSPATTVLPGADDYVYSLAWAPDGRTLWARSFNLTSRGYDVVEGTVLLDLPSPGRQEQIVFTKIINTWGVSADGRRLVASHHLSPGDPTMKISTHDLVSGGRWQEVPGVRWEIVDSNSLSVLTNMPRASRLEFLRATGAIGPSDLAPEDLAVARAGGSAPRVCSDPSGQLLVGPLVRYLERVDGTDQVPLLIGGRALPDAGMERHVKSSAASFSPDGRLLAAVRPTVHEGVVVHDVTTGDSVIELFTGGGETGVLLYAVAFSPDGRRLAVGGTDRVVSLFETTTWQLVARLEGHYGYIKDIAWSPDGDTLATASGDGTVRLWSATPLAERTVAAHAAAARREQQRPSVVALLARLDDPYAVAEAVRADASLDDEDRHAALRVVRELADVWWASRGDGTGDR